MTLITPNIDEAKVLTGKSIHNIEDMQAAAKMLTDDYQTNILLKGGHLEGDNMCDLLHTSESTIYMREKNESHNLHGTGCTLSSAIATYLAKGYPMRESIQHAKTYITQAIIAGKELNIGMVTVLYGIFRTPLHKCVLLCGCIIKYVTLHPQLKSIK